MLEEVLRQMGINSSFFLHFFIFIMVFVFLKYALFAPMLRHLHKRDEKTTLLAEQIRELKTKLDHRMQEYQSQKTQSQKEYADVINQYSTEAGELYRDMVTRERAKGLERLTKHREALAAEYAMLSGELILSLNDVKKSLEKHL